MSERKAVEMCSTWLLRCVAVLVVLGASGRAHASGFSTARFGGEHGTAADATPAAIYYNPAGIGLLDGQQLMIDATFAWRTSSYQRDADAISPSTLDAVDAAGLDRADAIDALTGTSELDDLVVLPFVGAVTDLGMPDSPLRIGAAFFVPFGGQSSWEQEAENSMFPGAQDGSPRWYNIEGTIRSLTGALAAAYRIESARLSFGVAGNLYYSEVNTLRARNPNGSDNLVGSDGRLAEGRSLLDVSGLHFGVGAGVMWEPIERALWLGLSYQSQPGFGTMELTGTLRNTLGTAAPSPADDVVFTQELPDIVRVGVRGRPWKQVELRLGADWSRWSQLEQMCIARASVGDAPDACATEPDGSLTNSEHAGDVVQVFQRRWDDGFGVRVSGSYFVWGDALELMAGAGFDSNAIPSSTLDPALYDMDKLSFSLASTYRINRKLAFTLTLTEVLYLERDTRGTAGNEQLELPSRQPGNAGVYTQNALLIQPAVQISL